MVLIAIAFALAYQTRARLDLQNQFYLLRPVGILLLGWTMLVWVALGLWFEIYGRIEAAHPRVILRDAFRQCLLGAASVILFEYVWRLDLSRLFLGLLGGWTWFLLSLFRLIAARASGIMRRGFGAPNYVMVVGLGEAAGKLLTNKRLRAKHLDCSVLAAAYRGRVPVTVHLAIGTDIPHMHRSADGAALGAASHHDFRLFCALVKQMHPGGVYLNCGSAVILPEVFLKAVSVARNLGTPLRPITTANFDFLQHYRPLQNVVRRPTARGRNTRGAESHGYAITGHHEIMLPLLAAAVAEAARRTR